VVGQRGCKKKRKRKKEKQKNKKTKNKKARPMDARLQKARPTPCSLLLLAWLVFLVVVVGSEVCARD
jgi:hypothetical protein